MTWDHGRRRKHTELSFTANTGHLNMGYLTSGRKESEKWHHLVEEQTAEVEK